MRCRVRFKTKPFLFTLWNDWSVHGCFPAGSPHRLQTHKWDWRYQGFKSLESDWDVETSEHICKSIKGQARMNVCVCAPVCVSVRSQLTAFAQQTDRHADGQTNRHMNSALLFLPKKWGAHLKKIGIALLNNGVPGAGDWSSSTVRYVLTVDFVPLQILPCECIPRSDVGEKRPNSKYSISFAVFLPVGWTTLPKIKAQIHCSFARPLKVCSACSDLQ